jgi:hypothetical protein
MRDNSLLRIVDVTIQGAYNQTCLDTFGGRYQYLLWSVFAIQRLQCHCRRHDGCMGSTLHEQTGKCRRMDLLRVECRGSERSAEPLLM